MNFKEAFKEMKENGKKVKLTTWSGYWYWDNKKKTVIIHTRHGEELDIRSTDRVDYTLMNMQYDNWIIADETNCTELGGITTFPFEEAIRLLKKGKKVTRLCWQDLKEMGISIYLEKGFYHSNTAPSNVIYKIAGTSRKIYSPSPMDIFAEDWTFYGNE